MGRRILGLPLAVLAAVLVLLAALTAAGGIPLPIATPLISAVVAAVLTGGLGLWGLWINLQHQIDRDRIDRLRDAYAKLLQAADKVREGVEELEAFPLGRPYPGIVPSIVTSGQGQVLNPPGSEDFFRYDPFHVLHAIMDRAGDLRAQAEVAIFLEEGPQSPVLKEWITVDKAYGEFRSAVSEDAGEIVMDQLAGYVLSTLDKLRETAHEELRSLATGRR